MCEIQSQIIGLYASNDGRCFSISLLLCWRDKSCFIVLYVLFNCWIINVAIVLVKYYFSKIISAWCYLDASLFWSGPMIVRTHDCQDPWLSGPMIVRSHDCQDPWLAGTMIVRTHDCQRRVHQDPYLSKMRTPGPMDSHFGHFFVHCWTSLTYIHICSRTNNCLNIGLITTYRFIFN